jgi:hypothetical protein
MAADVHGSVRRSPTEAAAIVRAITVIMGTVVGLIFLFGFGNVLNLALRLGVLRGLRPRSTFLSSGFFLPRGTWRSLIREVPIRQRPRSSNRKADSMFGKTRQATCSSAARWRGSASTPSHPGCQRATLARWTHDGTASLVLRYLLAKYPDTPVLAGLSTILPIGLT